MGAPETSHAGHTLIFGLSANPVHQGHIDLLVGTLSSLREMGYNVTQTLFVPVYRRNPVGNPKDVLPGTYNQRVKMCAIAAREVRTVHPWISISVSRIEEQLAMRNDKPNYTAETLTHLKKYILPHQELIFLLSSELFSGDDPEFNHWYQTDTILKTTKLAVCPRPGFTPNRRYLNELIGKGACIILLDNVTTPEISSTTLRHRLQKGENPLTLAQEGFIPMSIAHYLSKHNLYLDNHATLQKNQFHH